MTALPSQPEQANGLCHNSRGQHAPARPRNAIDLSRPLGATSSALLPDDAAPARSLAWCLGVLVEKNSNRFQTVSDGKLELGVPLELGYWNLDVPTTFRPPCFHSTCTLCEPKLHPAQIYATLFKPNQAKNISREKMLHCHRHNSFTENYKPLSISNLLQTQSSKLSIQNYRISNQKAVKNARVLPAKERSALARLPQRKTLGDQSICILKKYYY
jgi:hypothetical protein